MIGGVLIDKTCLVSVNHMFAKNVELRRGIVH